MGILLPGLPAGRPPDGDGPAVVISKQVQFVIVEVDRFHCPIWCGTFCEAVALGEPFANLQGVQNLLFAEVEAMRKENERLAAAYRETQMELNKVFPTVCQMKIEIEPGSRLRVAESDRPSQTIRELDASGNAPPLRLARAAWALMIAFALLREYFAWAPALLPLCSRLCLSIACFAKVFSAFFTLLAQTF